jgi:hypothetical protein
MKKSHKSITGKNNAHHAPRIGPGETTALTAHTAHSIAELTHTLASRFLKLTQNQ